MNQQTYVIVGANLCGGRAAETLRRKGFEGRLLLIGADAERPYHRPPLSKEYLRGEESRDRLFLQPAQFYAQQQIELRLGARATRVDTTRRIVELETGEQIGWEKLLIATGGRVRRLNVAGADLQGIYYLRTLADSERIRSEMESGRKLVVIGAGFIGAEVAASACVQGLEVTLLEVAKAPLARALGVEMGRIYAEIHRDHGVDLRLGCGVKRFEGSGRVERVITDDGKSVDCDFVVGGVGIDPETALVEGTQIELKNGIVVDEYCRTAVEGIFAAGDVANHANPILGERIRVEHWANAQNQGIAAARNMLERNEAYADVPWFWSDQYEINMQYLGYASNWDEVVLRGEVKDLKFTAFYLRGGKVRAAMLLKRPRDLAPIRELIKQQISVVPNELQNEDRDLRTLAEHPQEAKT